MIPISERTMNLAKVMELVGNKYSILLLHHLCESGPQRFKDCQEAHAISTRTLTLRLNELERAGLIERKEFREYPPRTEYSATELGRSLMPSLNALAEWGGRHLADMVWSADESK